MQFEKWQKFVTPIGRLRYHDLFTPKAMPAKQGEAQQEPKFGATLIVNPATFSKADAAAWDALKAYALAAGEELFPPKRDAKGVIIPGTTFADLVKLKALKWPFRNAMEKAGTAGFEEGMTFFAARAKASMHLDIVGPNKQPLEEKDVYPGCWGRLVVGPYAYNQGGGRGVSLGLYAFQKVRDDEPFVAGMGSFTELLDAVEDFVGTSTDASDPFGGL